MGQRTRQRGISDVSGLMKSAVVVITCEQSCASSHADSPEAEASTTVQSMPLAPHAKPSKSERSIRGYMHGIHGSKLR